MDIVAINVRKILESRGLKQKAVATKAGYTANEISGLLTGRRSIRTSDVVRIARALCVTPNELYGFSDTSGDN